ncbi:MAG: pyruvate kinase [Kiritimatiellia bacterium]|jgi:pyruvate kinase
MLTINYTEETSMLSRREAKILATLGTASATPDVMRTLIRAGVDGFRINMSHMRAEELAGWVHLARAAAAAEGAPVAVAVDLGGPKLRVGALPDGRLTLTEKEVLILGRDLPVSHPEILADIRPGQRILLDDGNLELEGLGAVGAGFQVRVKVGGLLLQGKGVNLPDTDLRLPAVTEKDLADLAAAVKAQVDYVSLSFVQRADDLQTARRAALATGPCPRLIAKIEKPAAVERFEEILAIADGIMVARGDLGVEVPPARVPVLQKQFISRANAEGKTIVTATQMLESMIHNPRPTRAEASDVANAVWDGTDAVMLSGETAVGKYPVEAVRMMRAIITEAEKAASPRREAYRGKTRAHALAAAAVEAAEELHAAAIVAITVSGYTAQMVAQRRPRVPLIAAVPDEHIRSCLSLVWGVTPIVVPWRGHSADFLGALETLLLKSGSLKTGDTVVTISGSTKLRGADYIMKIHDLGK